MLKAVLFPAPAITSLWGCDPNAVHMLRKLGMKAISALHSRAEQYSHPQLPGGRSCCALGNTLCQLSGKPRYLLCLQKGHWQFRQLKLKSYATGHTCRDHFTHHWNALTSHSQWYSGTQVITAWYQRWKKDAQKDTSNCSGRAVSQLKQTPLYGHVIWQSNKASFH